VLHGLPALAQIGCFASAYVNRKIVFIRHAMLACYDSSLFDGGERIHVIIAFSADDDVDFRRIVSVLPQPVIVVRRNNRWKVIFLSIIVDRPCFSVILREDDRFVSLFCRQSSVKNRIKIDADEYPWDT
jgi:hypothetical protein